MRDHPPIEDDHHDPKAMNYVGFQEVVLELITGRTHQVRGQLQSLQWHPEVMKLQDRISHFHIAGDNLYPGASTQSSRVEHDEEGDEEAEESMSMGKQRYVGDKTSIAVSRSCPHLALQACSIAINFKVKKVEQQLHFQINQPWWQSIFS
jgi:23S rRNA-/tRNA-specific pseudouridylate synthase